MKIDGGWNFFKPITKGHAIAFWKGNQPAGGNELFTDARFPGINFSICITCILGEQMALE